MNADEWKHTNCCGSWIQKLHAHELSHKMRTVKGLRDIEQITFNFPRLYFLWTFLIAVWMERKKSLLSTVDDSTSAILW